MTPELRNWYLSNLGIVQYVPKGEEPIALQFQTLKSQKPEQAHERDVKTHVASVLEMVQAEPVNTSLTDHQPTPPNTSTNKKAKAASVEKVSSSDTATTEVTKDSGTTSVSPSLRFRLACWHPCDDLLVFNQQEPGEYPYMAQNQLLSNILRAIGRLPQGLSGPEFIDWPMANSVIGHNDQIGVADRDEAQAMLSVFLDARIRKHGVLWVLLMGELATELLSPSDSSYADLLGRGEEIAGGAKTLVVSSLQEMLTGPELKAETWRTIRCLAQEN